MKKFPPLTPETINVLRDALPELCDRLNIELTPLDPITSPTYTDWTDRFFSQNPDFYTSMKNIEE